MSSVACNKSQRYGGVSRLVRVASPFGRSDWRSKFLNFEF
ncbi:hypothetical protein FDUTEX481_01476 [Tolypothrix sp. PCC 7601]|nr:hypothetical protein FDUTEX481_01476 [Tolypothrix sp. PCC 7601]